MQRTVSSRANGLMRTPGFYGQHRYTKPPFYLKKREKKVPFLLRILHPYLNRAVRAPCCAALELSPPPPRGDEEKIPTTRLIRTRNQSQSSIVSRSKDFGIPGPGSSSSKRFSSIQFLLQLLCGRLSPCPRCCL